MDIYTVHFDGSCWPNPGGTAASGYTLKLGDETVDSAHRVLGTGPKMSNNVAEYDALNMALESILTFVPKGANVVNVYGDSQLVIKQMNKVYKIRNGLYYPYARKAQELCAKIRKRKNVLYFEWVPRELNTEADDLSKAHRETEDIHGVLNTLDYLAWQRNV